MVKKHEPPHDPQRHGRRRIDALYHRIMAYAAAPETLRRAGRTHNHPAGADDGTELCLICATAQPTDTPRLDSVLYEAMFDQACIDTDGTLTNPYVIESKLARSSQRKAMRDYFGELWFVLIPAAYTLTTFTAADIARMASTVPCTVKPSHAARHLGNAAAADITGLPRAVATGSATSKLAGMCALLIEAHTRPVVFNPPRAERTSAQFIRDAHAHGSRGAVATRPRAAAASQAVTGSRVGAAKHTPARPLPTAQVAAAAKAPTTGKDWRTVLFGDADLDPARYLASLVDTPAANAQAELSRKKRLIEHTLSGLARQRAELDKTMASLSKQAGDLGRFDTQVTTLLSAYTAVCDTLDDTSD